MAAKDKPKVTNAEEIAAEERANERELSSVQTATARDILEKDVRENEEDIKYNGGRSRLQRSALYDIREKAPLTTGRVKDAYKPNVENKGDTSVGKYRMPVEDRLPRTKPLYGPGSPTDPEGTSEQKSTGLKKGGKVKAKAKAAAPKKFSRGGGIESKGKTKGRFV